MNPWPRYTYVHNAKQERYPDDFGVKEPRNSRTKTPKGATSTVRLFTRTHFEAHPYTHAERAGRDQPFDADSTTLIPAPPFLT